jgi:hypothetical protein
MIVEVGKTYEVSHSRKGKFALRVTKIDDDWITGVIVAGKAQFISKPAAGNGDMITLRKSFTTWKELK